MGVEGLHIVGLRLQKTLVKLPQVLRPRLNGALSSVFCTQGDELRASNECFLGPRVRAISDAGTGPTARSSSGLQPKEASRSKQRPNFAVSLGLMNRAENPAEVGPKTLNSP